MKQHVMPRKRETINRRKVVQGRQKNSEGKNFEFGKEHVCTLKTSHFGRVIELVQYM